MAPWIGAVLLLLVAISASGQTAPPIGIDGGEVRLQNGQRSQIVTLYATKALSDQSLKKITDVTLNAQPNVTFTVQKPLAEIDPRRWTVDVQATLAESYEGQRLAEATFGDDKDTKTFAFRYTLTNRPKVSAWSASGMFPKLVWPANTQWPIVVTVADGGATSPRVLRTTLSDAATDRIITPLQLDLCASGAPANGCPPATVAPGTPATIYMRPKNIEPGNYTGAVDLMIPGAAQSQTVSLTLSSSGPRWKMLGALLIVLGVLVSAVTTIFARNYANYVNALLPARRLSEFGKAKIEALEALGITEPQMSELVSGVGKTLQELEETHLRDEGFITSPRVPAVFRTGDRATDYAAYLQARSTRLVALAFLIDYGVRRVLLLVQQHSDKANAMTEAQKTLKHLDALAADSSKTVNDLAAPVAGILQALDQTLSGTISDATKTIATSSPSTQQLLVRLDSINAIVWLLWAIVTIVIGYAAVIMTNRGFGTPIDLVKAFFWGLGVQIAGEQLQQLRASAATTALGITVPS